MAAVGNHPSTDQSLSPYKSHLRNCKKPNNHSYPLFSQSLYPSFQHISNGNPQEKNNLCRRDRAPLHRGGRDDQARTTVYHKQSAQLCALVKRKTNNDRSLNSKKSKSSTNSPMKAENLPKDVTKFLSSNSSITNSVTVCSLEAGEDYQVDKFSGSVVSILSPPPSSLPLPSFPLRPKFSCNVKAAGFDTGAGIDTGATNHLRRLLRLP